MDFLFYLLFMITIGFNNNNYSTTDIEDIKIGNQIWSAKDLNVTKYKNGDNIIKASDSYEWRAAARRNEGAYYVHEGKYFYNWFAVKDARGLAPNGYHIPTFEEWSILLLHLGGLELEPDVLRHSGFYETKQGSMDSLVGYDGSGKWAKWWSSDKSSNNSRAFCCRLYNNKGAHLTSNYISQGLSVRCIRNK